jgi:hypothetical protein
MKDDTMDLLFSIGAAFDLAREQANELAQLRIDHQLAILRESFTTVALADLPLYGQRFGLLTWAEVALLSEYLLYRIDEDGQVK